MGKRGERTKIEPIRLTLICMLCVATHSVLAKQLPDDVPSCSRSDPNVEACLLNVIEKLRPYLPAGWPRANIPSFEPFFISGLKVNRQLQIGSRVKAAISNITATEFSKFIVQKLKVNTTTMRGEFHVLYPHMQFSAQYDIDGEIIGIPLVGKGGTTGNFTNVKVALTGSLKQIERNGVKYFKIDKLQSKMHVGDARASITSEHPQNVRTAMAVARLFNENPQRIMEILYPLSEETYDVVMKKIANKAITSIPAEEIFTD